MSGYNFETFQNLIIEKSVDKYFDESIKEWSLTETYESLKAEKCACGHAPIRKIHVYKNKLNGAKIILGKQCHTQFIQLQMNAVYDSLKNIQKSIKNPLGLAALKYAKDRKWITKENKKIYSRYCHKGSRYLSEHQKSQRIMVNKLILKSMLAKTPKIIENLNLVSSDDTTPFISETIYYLFFNACLTNFEKDFALGTMDIYYFWLTEAQKSKRVEINNSAIAKLLEIKDVKNFKKELQK